MKCSRTILRISGPNDFHKQLRMFPPPEVLRYRKIAAPSFNDRTHCCAWNESLGQTAALLKRWDSTQAPLMQVNEDVAKLTLQVISFVCFDRQIGWVEAIGSQEQPPKGHHMTYREAISSMVDCIPTLFIVPPPILSKKNAATRECLLKRNRYLASRCTQESQSVV